MIHRAVLDTAILDWIWCYLSPEVGQQQTFQDLREKWRAADVPAGCKAVSVGNLGDYHYCLGLPSLRPLSAGEDLVEYSEYRHCEFLMVGFD